MQISYPDWLTPQFVYITLSAVVAVLIWIEGEMLKKTGGKLPKSKFFQIGSFLDTTWFFVSVVVLYVIDLTPLAIKIGLLHFMRFSHFSQLSMQSLKLIHQNFHALI